MIPSAPKARFDAKVLRPAHPGDDSSWTFLVLPKEASKILPRRGRTSIAGTINGHSFQAMLEPDGQLSHWLKVGRDLQMAAGVEAGETVAVEFAPVEQEPEPELPADFEAALESNGEARRTWDETTTLARVDWIHWVTSAKQAKTRAKRVKDACEMLADGKKRVCCFDPSGYYSKAFSVPEAESSG